MIEKDAMIKSDQVYFNTKNLLNINNNKNSKYQEEISTQ
jgi:hypothetical protein